MVAPLRVMHMISGLGRGGAEVVLARFLKQTASECPTQAVLSLTSEGALASVIRELGIPVEAIGMSKCNAPRKLKPIVRSIRAFQPDILHCWMYQANLLGGLLWPFCDAKGMVWALHHSKLDRRVDGLSTRLSARASVIVSRRADRIISCSQSGLEYHRSIGYPSERLTLVANGFDTDVFQPSSESKRGVRQELGARDDEILIGTVARYHPTKGYPTLVEAAEYFLESTPNIRFVFVGQDVCAENPAFRRLAKNPRFSSRVHLLGSRDDVARIMPALDLYTSASYSEAFSVTIGEAMACGTPCVVTDVGDSSLLVGDTGYVVPSRNSTALVRAWAELMSMEPAERSRIGLQGRERIKTCFDLNQSVSQYWEVYEDVVDQDQGMK